MAERLRPFLLTLCSGGLLSLSFPRWELSFLAWVALVPLLLGLRRESLRASFGLGFVTGVSAWLGTVSWVGDPAEVAAVDVLLIVTYLGIYVGVFGLACRFVSQGTTLPLLCTAPVLWVSLEYLRAHFFFLEFPWTLLGHSQYRNLALIQIASVTGAYGVSFLIVMANVALYEIIENRRRAVIPALSVLVLVGFVMGVGQIVLAVPSERHTVTVTIIPGNVPQSTRWDDALRDANLAHYVQLTERASATSPSSLIVWPETAVPGDLRRDVRTVEMLSRLVREANVPLLVGSAERAKFGPSPQTQPTLKRRFNSAFLISPRDRSIDAYYKMKLMPFGEYLPLNETFPWPSRYVSQAATYSPGEEYVVFAIPGADRRMIKFSVLLCWETIFPDLASQFVKRGAQFLVAMSNEAWFSGTAAPYQFLSMNVFRAVENRRALVRSVNGGVSGMIDPYGRLIATISPDEGERSSHGFLTQEVPIIQSQTFYALYGDVFAQSTVAAAVVLLLAPLRRPRLLLVAKEH